MLIDDDFLNRPKSAKEIHEETKKEGYYHSLKNIDGTLRIVFVKKKVLQRIHEDKIWKYVVRK